MLGLYGRYFYIVRAEERGGVEDGSSSEVGTRFDRGPAGIRHQRMPDQVSMVILVCGTFDAMRIYENRKFP